MTEAQPTHPTRSTSSGEPQLERLDPHVLRTASNVRSDLHLEKPFIDSIRQHGVLEPIVGHRGPDGAVTIAYGHRRAAAAIEAGLTTVPVVVHHDPAASEGSDRVLAQVVENEHRAGLSTADRVGAYRQLAAFGLSATQIARRSATRKTDVAHALKLAGTDLAVAATARYELTLEEGSVLSEFATDKEAVTALVAGAKTGQFAHVAQRLRDQRDFQQAVTYLTSRLTADGITVVDQPTETRTRRGSFRRVEELAQDGQPLDADGHRACPGHAAYLERSWGEEPVRPVWVCQDPAANGHSDRHRPGAPVAPPGLELSEEEKAERRRVREHNADWRSAETVRRDYLRQLLNRKTPPTGTRRFLAESLIAADHPLRRALERGHPLARDLLGADLGGDGLAALLDQASEPRSEVIALGAILCAHEDATDVHTWRNPDRASRRYLDFLRTTGYQLSEIEQTVASPQPNPTSSPATSATRSRRRTPSGQPTGSWAPTHQRTAAVDPGPDRPPPPAA